MVLCRSVHRLALVVPVEYDQEKQEEDKWRNVSVWSY